MIDVAITPRLRKRLLWAAYPLFGLAVGFVTLYATLPRDRIKDRLETAIGADAQGGGVLALGMETTIGDLGLTAFTGAGIKVTDVQLRSRPQNPTDKPARYVIDTATVHCGLLGLLFGRPTYSFSGQLMQGTVEGSVTQKPEEEIINVVATGINLSGPQGVSAALGFPIEGTLSGKLDVVVHKYLAANSDGSLELTLENAVIGDGKAKLTVPGDAFLSQGITVPRIKFGTLSAKLVIEKGKARIENMHMKSVDGEAMLEGYLDLRDPLNMSQLHGYLKIKPSEALMKREPTIELMNSALSNGKRPDGFIGFQISGPLSALFYMPNANPPPGVAPKSAAPIVPPSAPMAPKRVPPPPVPPPTAGTHVPPPPPSPETPPPPPAPAAEAPPPPTPAPGVNLAAPPSPNPAALRSALHEAHYGAEGDQPAAPPPTPPPPPEQ